MRRALSGPAAPPWAARPRRSRRSSSGGDGVEGGVGVAEREERDAVRPGERGRTERRLPRADGARDLEREDADVGREVVAAAQPGCARARRSATAGLMPCGCQLGLKALSQADDEDAQLARDRAAQGGRPAPGRASARAGRGTAPIRSSATSASPMTIVGGRRADRDADRAELRATTGGSTFPRPTATAALVTSRAMGASGAMGAAFIARRSTDA